LRRPSRRLYGPSRLPLRQAPDLRLSSQSPSLRSCLSAICPRARASGRVKSPTATDSVRAIRLPARSPHHRQAPDVPAIREREGPRRHSYRPSASGLAHHTAGLSGRREDRRQVHHCLQPALRGQAVGTTPPFHSPGQRVEWPRATTDSGTSVSTSMLSRRWSRGRRWRAWPTRSPCPVSVRNIVRLLLLSPSYSAACLASSATGAVTLL
jgi:hypothetical protein